jgi:hypothetical protein
VIFLFSEVAVVTSPKSFGMTESDCRFMQSAWTVESSSGPPLRMARCRSRQLRWPICWKRIDWRNPQLTWRPRSAG